MDENFRRQMEENGADVDTTIKRFLGNEAMYMKFIMKFLDDKNMAHINEGIQNHDYKAVFEGAHSLKGVAANLGLNPVCDLASQLTELLRGKTETDEVDGAQVAALRERLEETYLGFQNILSANNK
ncbi:MAG: Hpt domain-containing protein [Roseburia sp.]|nr:Hpt domain-containing protein [Roseburia sp.]